MIKMVFADTGYWIALVNPRDVLRAKAAQVSKSLGNVHIVTSELVLTELLNAFSSKGAALRGVACDMVAQMRADPYVEIVGMTAAGFEAARSLYCSRLDKEWSLTDCASFQIMKAKGIVETLAADHHFEQAGFNALLR